MTHTVSQSGFGNTAIFLILWFLRFIQDLHILSPCHFIHSYASGRAPDVYESGFAIQGALVPRNAHLVCISCSTMLRIPNPPSSSIKMLTSAQAPSAAPWWASHPPHIALHWTEKAPAPLHSDSKRTYEALQAEGGI